MMDKLKDVLGSVTDTSARYANAVGCRTSALARRVGPKRGGIALGVLAVAIGTPLLVRYLRARNAEMDVIEEEQELTPEGSVRRRRTRRGARRTYVPTSHA